MKRASAIAKYKTLLSEFPVRKMTISHLRNCIAFLERVYREDKMKASKIEKQFPIYPELQAELAYKQQQERKAKT